MINSIWHNSPSPIHCLRAFHILFFAYLLFRCYCYHHYKIPKKLLLLPLPLLSYYFATKHFAADTKFPGVGWIDNSAANTWEYSLAPLVSNQQIWVEYSTLENCCDPLYLWVIIWSCSIFVTQECSHHAIFYGSRPWRSDYERARRRALAIAKPTSEGYWPRRSTINLTTRACFLRANEEQARN